ncbi:hypothetical protein ACHFJ0_00995 [Paracoccus sp. NGMCC 1.201697]|uniref:Colicin import membrane protein n=1 Tax=Paracoccus broussonetiae subsp. drimophilus TaxID=3373869 RepID=A0ABW7LF96_9RHOB
MARNPEDSVTHSRDLDEMVEQTQPAALRALENRALAALLRDLRAMKAQETDVGMQKALAQAIRRAAAEKRERSVEQEDTAPAAEAPPVEAKPGKAERAEAKLRKEAERAEKKRVKAAEREERKTAKALERAQIKAEKLALKEQSLPPGKKAKLKKEARKDGKPGKGAKADKAAKTQ